MPCSLRYLSASYNCAFSSQQESVYKHYIWAAGSHSKAAPQLILGMLHLTENTYPAWEIHPDPEGCCHFWCLCGSPSWSVEKPVLVGTEREKTNIGRWKLVIWFDNTRKEPSLQDLLFRGMVCNGIICHWQEEELAAPTLVKQYLLMWGKLVWKVKRQLF